MIRLKKATSGFAMILALMLMGFIFLLLVSLSTLVSTEIQLNGTNQRMQEARMNALLGLDIALGSLQQAAGPDQRSTARADILSDTLEENGFWTGVWKTVDVDNPAQDLETLRQWSTQPNQIEWLISSEQQARPETSLDSTNPTAGTVPLVYYTERGTGTSKSVEAGKVPLDSQAGRATGHFAWWVGDEGIKAKFNPQSDEVAVNLSADETWLDAQRSLSSPKRNGVAVVSGMSDVLTYDSLGSGELDRISNILDIGYVADSSITKTELNDFRKNHFHDITFSSYGVLSNQRYGGLKKDLSRGLDDQFPETLAGRPLWWLPEPGTSSVVKGELWDVIYDYANLYRDYPAWQFSGTINDSGYTYQYTNHDETGPQGLGDPRSETDAVAMRFFGPESTSGKGSFNRLGKNVGAKSYLTNQVISQYADDHWGVSDSGNQGGRPLWNAIKPVVLACLWRVGVGSVDLMSYSQSGAFQQDGMYPSNKPEYSAYDLRQYDETTGIRYDYEATAYTDHPLDLPPDWEGRPASGPHAVQGIPRKYYRMHFVLQPIVVLWNPYNVPLEVTDLLVSPKFEPWVSIDYDDGSGSGVKPVKVQKYMSYRTSGTDYWFRLLEDFPHSIYSGSPSSNNDSEADDRFLLADDALMSGAEFNSGIRINDFTLGPGQIEVFSLNENVELPATLGGDMVARPINTDAVLVKRTPLKHDFPAGTQINSIQLFYDPSDVPNLNAKFDGRLNTMNLDVQSLNQDLSPGTKTSPFFSQVRQFGPSVIEGGDWDDKHEFELDVSIESIQVPDSGSGMRINEPFTNVQWFAVIGAQTKNIEELERGVPLFSQFNVARMADRPNPSDTEMAGVLWDAKFYSDPEFQDAIESDEIPFWDGDSEVWNGVDRVVLKEVPRQPLSSVAQLMNANLSVNDWDPLYAVGSSYSHPLIEPEEVINSFDQQNSSNQVSTNGNLAMDLSFLANERLFDDYFFSTVPPQNSDPTAAGYSRTYEPDEVPPFKAYTTVELEAGMSFPNPRMRSYKSDVSLTTDEWMEVLRDYDTAATQLMVDGAFNVNSTSVEAWKALLSSVRNQMIPSATGGINTDEGDSGNPFLRVAAPLNTSEVTTENLYAGFASLDDDAVERLAEAIVDEVKARGPFLSMSDFVNRRLEDSELGQKGALQAALDNSVNTINNRFGESVTLGSSGSDNDLWLTDKQGGRLLRTEQLVSQQGAGLPQWILQNDVLRALAPVMQARSDTFVIRSYGDVTNFTGQVVSRVWCEAVVQRVPDYVDTISNPNSAVPPWNVSADSSGARLDAMVKNVATGLPDALSEINFNYGRQFRIVSFRWLNEDEI